MKAIAILVCLLLLAACTPNGPEISSPIASAVEPLPTATYMPTPTPVPTCLEGVPVYPDAVTAERDPAELVSFIEQMAMNSGVADGDLAIYTADAACSEVFGYYREYAPVGDWHKALDVYSSFAGGLIVWEQDGMSVQMLAAPEEDRVLILLRCGLIE